MRYSSSLSTALCRPLRPTLPVETLMERVRLVLETTPGLLPWQPDFGCALEELAGEAMATTVKERVQNTVVRAIRRWVPEVKVLGCVTSIRIEDRIGGRGPGVPLAEAALVPFAAHAILDIQLVLEGPAGPFHFDFTLPT